MASGRSARFGSLGSLQPVQVDSLERLQIVNVARSARAELPCGSPAPPLASSRNTTPSRRRASRRGSLEAMAS
jgi:hypothetical protein